MPAPSSKAELLDFIARGGIASAEDLARRVKVAELPDDPHRCASSLIKAGVITQFQAKLLLAGRYRGFKLGSYIVRDQLGQGGMGAVYLAEHATLKRKVAVKVLAPTDGMNRVAVERFLREARAAAALDHPNIVRIFDVSKQGEMHYLAMEYVDGQTLDQMVESGGSLSAGRAVELMLMAAAGLQHAYEKGFVHRDIKPGNLIVAKDGTLKILDMGLARSQEVGDKLTEILDKGAVVGTADYISPEQAVNSPDLDIRADIYSLGATFFTVVAGRPPFEGNTTQKLVQHQMKDPPSLTTIDKTFPPGLAAVVAKMLKKRPADRYQTPADLINALAPWLSNTPRVVATLSRTNLGSSKAASKTMKQVARGSTGRLPSITSRGGRSLTLPLAVGGGLLALLLIGGVIYALSGSEKPAPQPIKPVEVVTPAPTATIVPPTPAPTISEPPPPTVPTLVPSQPGVVYQLNLVGRGAYTEAGTVLNDPATLAVRWKLDPTQTVGSGPFPPGWQPSATETGGSYQAKILAPPALSVAPTGSAAATLLTPELPTGSGMLAVTTDIQSDKPIKLRFRPTKPLGSAVAVGEFPANSSAQTLDAKLPPGQQGRFEFVAVPTATLTLADFTVIDSTPPGKWLSKLDTSKLQPFVQRTRNFMQPGSSVPLTIITETGPGAMPPGFYRWISEPGAVAEFFADGKPGALALGCRLISGGGSVQINTPEFTAPSGHVRLRMLYSTGPNSPGAVARLKPAGNRPIFDAVDLPPTGGSWRLVDADVDLRGAKGGLFELANLATGVEGALLIREYAVLGE